MGGDCSAPMFSPNGDWLAFQDSGDPHERKSSLCLIRPDGTDFVRLPDSHGIWHAFHPQSDRLVFSRHKYRNSDSTRRNANLYSLDIDGLSSKRLTDSEANDKGPSFSPDGTQIVFCSDRDGFDEIYTLPYED
jgi:TolB protein